MNEIQVVNDNDIVVQSSELIEANYKLSISEQRLILALSSQIDTRKSDFEIVRITAKSLSDACGFNPKDGYRQLQQTAKKLLNRSLIIKNRDNNDWYGTHWVQYCEYRSIKNDNMDCSYIEVEFDKRLCPHLLQLSNKFLKTNLSQLVSFSHIYSTRFYMIFRNLVNHLTQCQKKYTFKEIITLLELPKTYEKSIVNLKYKVIKVAVDEINEKSDIEVEYKYYRDSGRAHTGVVFTFWKKNDREEIALPDPADEIEQTVDAEEETNRTEEQQADYDRLLKYGVWAKTAKHFVVDYDHAQIERNIRGVLKSNLRGNIKDLGAVLANAIDNDTFHGEAEEEVKAKEREQARKKAEWEQIQKDTNQKEENHKLEREKNKKLEKIRNKKTREELIEIFEKVSLEYKNNNEVLNDEMVEELEKNGISRTDFAVYQSTSLRNIIKYI